MSEIYFDRNISFYCKDYYDMIVNDLYQIISNYNINIIVGDYNYTFLNNKKTIKIGINFEHTLVLQGEEKSLDAPIGNIIWNNQKYLVRCENLNMLSNSDIIIDYSLPNIRNVSSFYPKFSRKLIYYPPILFDYISDLNKSNEIEILTTFINPNLSRRKKLLNKFKLENINYKNVSDQFGSENLKKLYKKTKILVNIHQTDYHHTFEELRVLPALLCNTIVISEESPLTDLVPYKDFIIWCKYDEIVNKIKFIQSFYEIFHDAFFGDNKFKKLVESMKTCSLNNLKDCLSMYH